MPNDMGVGAPVKRVEDRRFTTGRGRYTDDFTVQGLHHAAFVRSPHGHARIARIDKSAAEAAPGVVAVYDGSHDNELCGLQLLAVVVDDANDRRVTEFVTERLWREMGVAVG